LVLAHVSKKTVKSPSLGSANVGARRKKRVSIASSMAIIEMILEYKRNHYAFIIRKRLIVNLIKIPQRSKRIVFAILKTKLSVHKANTVCVRSDIWIIKTAQLC